MGPVFGEVIVSLADSSHFMKIDCIKELDMSGRRRPNTVEMNLGNNSVRTRRNRIRIINHVNKADAIAIVGIVVVRRRAENLVFQF